MMIGAVLGIVGKALLAIAALTSVNMEIREIASGDAPSHWLLPWITSALVVAWGYVEVYL